MNLTPFPSKEYQTISRMQDILGCQDSRYYPVGIGDDAAVRVDGENNTLVITTDLSVENVHFSCAYMTMQEVGYRAMVSNISDCAAMGAVPDSAFIQLVVPTAKPDFSHHIDNLYRGFKEACDAWNFPVSGGDLSKGESWVIGITLIGRIPQGGRPLLRKGMKPGDAIYISGTPGRSAAGLHLLQTYGREAIPQKYRALSLSHIRPTPRVALGVHLRTCGAVHAMMDCSDGLSKDCRTLCHENGAGIILYNDTSLVPAEMLDLSRDESVAWHNWFYHGGEDYELLFAAGDDFDPRLCPGGAPLCIGKCTSEYRGLMLQTGSALVPLEACGFDHFGTDKG